MNPNRDDTEARLHTIEVRLAALEGRPIAPREPWLPKWARETIICGALAVAAISVVVGVHVGYLLLVGNAWIDFRREHKCVSGVLTHDSGFYRFLDSDSNCYDCDIGRVCK